MLFTHGHRKINRKTQRRSNRNEQSDSLARKAHSKNRNLSEFSHKEGEGSGNATTMQRNARTGLDVRTDRREPIWRESQTTQQISFNRLLHPNKILFKTKKKECRGILRTGGTELEAMCYTRGTKFRYVVPILGNTYYYCCLLSQTHEIEFRLLLGFRQHRRTGHARLKQGKVNRQPTGCRLLPSSPIPFTSLKAPCLRLA